LESGENEKEREWKFFSFHKNKNKVVTICQIVANKHSRNILGIQCKEIDLAYQELDPDECAESKRDTLGSAKQKNLELALGVTNKPDKKTVSAFMAQDPDKSASKDDDNAPVTTHLAFMFANSKIVCEGSARLEADGAVRNGRPVVFLSSSAEGLIKCNNKILEKLKLPKAKSPPETYTVAVLLGRDFMDKKKQIHIELDWHDTKPERIAHDVYSHYVIATVKGIINTDTGTLLRLHFKIADSTKVEMTNATKVTDRKLALGIKILAGANRSLNPDQQIESVDASGAISFLTINK
jgi:hypothetical protein